jgi:GNAT superfamily N-acetyltransferase
MNPGRHLTVETRTLSDPDVQAMLARLDRELLEATPDGGSNFFHIEHDQLQQGDGAFFVAVLDCSAVGCGAYRRIDAHSAEVKRMWSDPAARGRGVGAAVLTAIIAAATADGFRELRLETGEYLTAAVTLYRKFGFAGCPAWGEYVGVPLSYCMSRPLP